MRTALAVLAVLISATPSAAQDAARAPHVFLGGSLIVAEPQQDFREHVNTSYGGALNVVWKPQTDGALGLRFEGGAIGYGHETQRVPFSETVGGRVMVDVSTSNFIAFAHVGPQLMLPRGPVRPYLAPSAGFAYIATVSSVEDDHHGESVASDTNYDDLVFSYGATAGLYVPVSRTVAVDFGLRYHQNGQASYLVKGSIQDNEDGSISFDPIRGSANMLTFQLGVSIGITDKKR